VTPERVADGGVHYRIFANGMVVVNPTDRAAKLAVTHRWPTSVLHDLYENATVKAAGTVTLRIPAQSGRVYLFEPVTVSTEAETGETKYTLTIETRPALGKTRFLVDGIPLWTYSGRWTTEYVATPRYGTCDINFDGPGKHRVEVLDLEKKALLVAEDYGSAYSFDQQLEEDAEHLKPGQSPRLGRFMDPANPTRFLEGAGYRFAGWKGRRAKDPVVEIEVTKPTTLVARFRRG